MARIPLINGAYSARSIIANVQRCVNLYPELNPKDSPVPYTHYQRPGLTLLASGPSAPVRGIWRASNGNGYCVIGTGVYSISKTFVLTQIGTLLVNKTTPCTFVDNGISAMLADGSGFGYQINLTTNVFSQIIDSTGTFVGADKLDFIDTFILFNIPGTNQFGCTLSNSIAFLGTYIAAKTAWPDPIVSIVCVRRQIYLLGQLKSEIWYDAGAALFPFAEIPGVTIEHGCCAKYSVANEDFNVFWLGQDLQGQGVVFMVTGYSVQRISNHAIENIIAEYATNFSISDAVGYCYQQNGHVFYVLSFPSANATWVFDKTTGLWHQRAWLDQNGNLNRDRANCHALLYGRNVVGDWENGNIYLLDQNNYTDNGTPITYIRGFPHVEIEKNQDGQVVHADGKRVKYENFVADIEAGMGANDGSGSNPQVLLRWSIDRGRTFGNAVALPLGLEGHFLSQPKWNTLGIARDMVFELEYTSNGPAALNGAWIDATILET